MKPPILITSNKNKLREINELITPIKLNSLSLNLPEIQSLDPIKILKEKALQAYKMAKKPVLIEDTSLFIDELNGLPGPLVKWFTKKLSLAKIAQISNNSKASAQTLLCLFTGKHFHIFSGRVRGKITSPKGNNGFGWDAIFIPENCKKTFAQMTPQEKNKISHRTLAAEKLKKFLLKS